MTRKVYHIIQTCLSILYFTLQSVGLPAKQGLFRNMSNTVVKCKEFLCWTDNEDELTKLQSMSVCPVSVKNQKLFYEVEIDEKKKLLSPQEILVHIYQKLYGELASNKFFFSISFLNHVVH